MAMESTIERTCGACSNTFLVPVAEQQFRLERGLPEPLECPECRARLRSVRNSDLIALYERGSSHTLTEVVSISHRNSGSKEHKGGRSNVVQQRYNTVCAACGAETQVPFVPRGDRPVYCRDCFNARKGR